MTQRISRKHQKIQEQPGKIYKYDLATHQVIQVPLPLSIHSHRHNSLSKRVHTHFSPHNIFERDQEYYDQLPSENRNRNIPIPLPQQFRGYEERKRMKEERKRMKEGGKREVSHVKKYDADLGRMVWEREGRVRQLERQIIESKKKILEKQSILRSYEIKMSELEQALMINTETEKQQRSVYKENQELKCKINELNSQIQKLERGDNHAGTSQNGEKEIKITYLDDEERDPSVLSKNSPSTLAP